MPTRKKSAAKKPAKSFEETLWDTANTPSGQDQWEWGDHLRRAKRARRVRPHKLANMNLAERGLSANLKSGIHCVHALN